MFQATNDARDLLVMYENLLEKFEALNFRLVAEKRRIECHDPSIWVEDYGTGYDFPREFVLSWYGKRIGFGEKYSRVTVSEAISIVNVGKPKEERIPLDYDGVTWIIGQMGQQVIRMGDREVLVHAKPFTFTGDEELQIVLAIIKVALSVHCNTARGFTGKYSRVIFLPEVFARP